MLDDALRELELRHYLVGALQPSRAGSRYLVAYQDALGATRTYHLRTPADVHATLASWASV